MQGECKNHDGAEANGMIVVPVLGVAWLVGVWPGESQACASHRRLKFRPTVGGMKFLVSLE